MNYRTWCFITAPLILMMVLFSGGLSAQTNLFGPYKYLYLPALDDHFEEYAAHTISEEIAAVFTKKGFEILTDFDDAFLKNTEIMNNRCFVLACEIDDSLVGIFNSTVKLTFYNCLAQRVFFTEGIASYGEGEYNIRSATRKALVKIREMKYEFTPGFTPHYGYPEVGQTGLTSIQLMEYFEKNKLDEIEGIYETAEADFVSGYYKFGIKKFGDSYKAVLFESNYKHWKQGEVKGEFKPGLLKGTYSSTWYLRDKVPAEAIAVLRENDTLSLLFSKPGSENKIESKMKRIFPRTGAEIKYPYENFSPSNLGVVLSTDGIIVTNAHTIKKAANIKIKLTTELGELTFPVELLIKDEEKNLAILKIDQSGFTGFNSHPFGLEGNTKKGEFVYSLAVYGKSPSDKNLNIIKGSVNYSPEINNDYNYILVKPSGTYMSNGGPLFNLSGNMIGLIPFSSGDTEQTADREIFAIKSASIIQILEQIQDKLNLPTVTDLNGKPIVQQASVLKNYICEIIAE